MIVQRQVWHDYTKYLIADGYGSVQVGLYDKEQSFGGTAFIYGLYVCPSYRGNHLGEALLDQAEFCAKHAGHKSVFLEWEEKDSPKWVLEWYLRLGYKEVESDKQGCLLKKELK